MNSVAIELYDHFKIIEANYNTLLALCQTEEQQNQLRAIYNQAYSNYNLAIAKVLDENDLAVRTIHQQLVQEKNNIVAAINSLDDIVGALNTIAQAVSLGAGIIGL